MKFFDTHAHIHFDDYGLDPDVVIEDARKAGVTRLLCVGCTLDDSKLGIEMAAQNNNIWASIGLHPHEGAEYIDDPLAIKEFQSLALSPKVVAVGETGLDYYYEHSPKEVQKKLLIIQLALAKEHNLPVIFHLRGAKDNPADVFDDFFAIVANFEGIRGVVHSFTGTKAQLDKILNLGLYIGLNGIMTFTKDQKQLEMAKAVPLSKLLLETDAPFLTPSPFRGTICQPKHLVLTAEFLATLRGESLEQLAEQTTENARELFNL